MTEATHTLLVVEDNLATRRLLEEAVVETQLLDLEFATEVTEARKYFPQLGKSDSEPTVAPPDLLLVDLDLPGKTGRYSSKNSKLVRRLCASCQFSFSPVLVTKRRSTTPMISAPTHISQNRAAMTVS